MRLPAYLAPHVAESTGHTADPFHRYRRTKYHLSRIRHPGNPAQQYAPCQKTVLTRKGAADAEDGRKESFFYGNCPEIPDSSNRGSRLARYDRVSITSNPRPAYRKPGITLNRVI